MQSNVRKRYYNTSSPIPVKKSKIDSDVSHAKPLAAMSKKNDVLDSAQSAGCKTTLNSNTPGCKEHPNKKHTYSKSNSVPKQPLQTLSKSKRDNNVMTKLNVQTTTPIPIQISSTNQEKSEDLKSSISSSNNPRVIQTQINAEANVGYDIESESDFLG